MKFLFDTNVLIPAEPTSPEHIESETSVVTELLGLVQEAGYQSYIHPASAAELGNDSNKARRNLRSHLIRKYVSLPSPPVVSPNLKFSMGVILDSVSAHDEVDNLLLAAVAADSVDYLVTNDQDIHKKAIRAGFQERVVSPADAIAIIRGLFPIRPMPPPAVAQVLCHELDQNDPIFESLRKDYPDFDNWLRKCKREHRSAWIVRKEDERLSGISIVKTEQTSALGFLTPCLKLCTFKISEESRGVRLGELLLKAVFLYSFKNSFCSMYVTAFAKHGELISLFDQFGFQAVGGQSNFGEVIFHKKLRFDQQEYDTLSSLEFNKYFGPFHVKLKNTNSFVVPIIRKYHDLLFPETQEQPSLFPGTNPFGNSIKKAYLSNSPNRQLVPGDLLLFYRSGTKKDVICIGVVEETFVSNEAEKVMRFVGKRTVYPFDEIKNMCHSPVLGILFRQARTLDQPVTLRDLQANGLLKAAPQSITKIKEVANAWLRDKIEMWS